MPLTADIAAKMTRAALQQSPAALSFSWRGKTYTGRGQDMRTSRTYRYEGATDGYTITFVGVAADFAGGFPPNATVLTVNGTQLRVAETRTDAARGAVFIDFAEVV